ncbi:MAG: sodium:calcium antiporter [Pseudomonadota bacterium]
MILDILLPLGLGGALLAWGGDRLVEGASEGARRLRLSPIFIGTVLVGFGTSAPELLTSVAAARSGLPDIALGNVVGSNITNVLLIGGVVALLAPWAVAQQALARDYAFGVAAVALLAMAMLGGALHAMTGALFLLLLGCVTIVALMGGGQAAKTVEIAPVARPVLWRAGLYGGLGLAAALFGAGLFVEGASDAARAFGMSEAAIGASIVALGTSLPELATSVMAARRREAGIALGNIVGSNLFNVLGVLGATLLVAGITPAAETLWRDLPVLVLTTLALGWLLLGPRGAGRATGVALLGTYVLYLALML